MISKIEDGRIIADGELSTRMGALNGLRQVQDMKIKLEKWWR